MPTPVVRVLGDTYKNGQGVPQDDAEAFRWYRLAAEQNHCGAQLNLARSYFEGLGVPQGYALAHIWANRASGNAPRDLREECIKVREQAQEHFSRSDIPELQRLAREWPRGAETAAAAGNQQPTQVFSEPSGTQATQTDDKAPAAAPAFPTATAPAADSRQSPRPSVTGPASLTSTEESPLTTGPTRRVWPWVLGVVLALGFILVQSRYEYDPQTLSVSGLSVDYQVRTDRWTGETCNVYSREGLGVLPAALLRNAC